MAARAYREALDVHFVKTPDTFQAFLRRAPRILRSLSGLPWFHVTTMALTDTDRRLLIRADCLSAPTRRNAMHATKREGSIPSRTDVVSDPIDVEQVYARYLDPIYRFLYSRVGNREDAEDLTSQVFLKAFRRLDVARGERSIVSWLFTVARTVLMDHWRQQYRQGARAELNDNLIDCTDLREEPDDSAKLRCVNEVLALLPPRSRAVLELRFLQGYTVEETSRALGITPANVKVTQHRALARAADLVEYDQEEITARGADGRAIA